MKLPETRKPKLGEIVACIPFVLVITFFALTAINSIVGSNDVSEFYSRVLFEQLTVSDLMVLSVALCLISFILFRAGEGFATILLILNALWIDWTFRHKKESIIIHGLLALIVFIIVLKVVLT